MSLHQKVPKDFIVTKKAAEKLIEVLKENNKENFGLRVEVVTGGCSGFQYGLNWMKIILILTM